MIMFSQRIINSKIMLIGDPIEDIPKSTAQTETN